MQRAKRIIRSLLACSAIIAIAGAVQVTKAHRLPADCTSSGPTLLIREFHDSNGNDTFDPGTDQIVTGAKADGETIFYILRVAHSSALGQCAYEGGTLLIDPPGAVGPTDVTPAGGVPLICDTCIGGVAFFDSEPLAYTVDFNDATQVGDFTDNDCIGQLRANGRLQGATSHSPTGSDVTINADTKACNDFVAVDITKSIACRPADGDCSAATYANSATGAKSDTQDPAFCYSITITNTGTSVLTLTNVNDDVYGDLLPDVQAELGGSDLAVGGSVTIMFSDSHSVDTTNTVTVLGTDVSGEAGVEDSDDAIANVVPASIACTKTHDNPVIPLDGTPVDVHYSVVVTNTGAVDVVVDIEDSFEGNLGTAVSIPVNGSVSSNYTRAFTCAQAPTSVTNTVTVTGVVDVNNTQGICVYDANGDAIAVETDCEAIVEVPQCEGGDCVTRTPGYWFTHHKNDDANCATLKKAIEAAGGTLDLGFIVLPTQDRDGGGISSEDTLIEALGMFWKRRTLTGEAGGLQTSKLKASSLCRARKQLAFHLIAAIANVELLGTNPASCPDPDGGSLPGNLIEQAQAIAACDDIQAIRAITEQLDQFNNSGDDNGFPDPLKPCKANPRDARSIARDPTTQANCDSTANCVP